MAMVLYKGRGNDVLVWRAEDIAELRHRYRIIGKLIGSHPKVPRQNHMMTRPMLLSPYETTLLVEKGFASLRQENAKAPWLDKETVCERQRLYEEHHSKSLNKQIELAFDQKKSVIMSRSKEIVDGIIKKKGMEGACSEEYRASILSDIIDQAKKQPIQEQHMLVQQPIETPWACDLLDAKWDFPQTEQEKIKYLVFKDLWQQEFSMTCGAKFGGDFLVYPGDPELYHAKYIAICQQPSEAFCQTDMVQSARLASNVKKTALFCKVDMATKSVSYTKLDYSPT